MGVSAELPHPVFPVTGARDFRFAFPLTAASLPAVRVGHIPANGNITRLDIIESRTVGTRSLVQTNIYDIIDGPQPRHGDGIITVTE